MENSIIDECLDSSEDSLRSHSIYFSEILILCCTAKGADDVARVKQVAVTLDQIQADHSILDQTLLAQKADRVLKKLNDKFVHPSISISNLLAIANSLFNIAKSRRVLAPSILQAFVARLVSGFRFPVSGFRFPFSVCSIPLFAQGCASAIKQGNIDRSFHEPHVEALHHANDSHAPRRHLRQGALSLSRIESAWRTRRRFVRKKERKKRDSFALNVVLIC